MKLYVSGGSQRDFTKRTPDWKLALLLELDADTGRVESALEYVSPPEVCPETPSITFKAATLTGGRLYICTQTEVLVYRVPGFELDEFEAVHVRTANLPAEFGRRLGGVIELHTRRSDQMGHHPEFAFQAGTFDTVGGAYSHYYQNDGTSILLGVRGGHTKRYLDPPSLQNFTNKASSAGLNARFEHDLSGHAI